ncbi:MAG: N-acetylmuramoyl-L-alanine amidase [Proteobacteria bacterium]|nr:N-acetylmuramoyl-L-alanine amidase [Pseudomonadota bacterium]
MHRSTTLRATLLLGFTALLFLLPFSGNAETEVHALRSGVKDDITRVVMEVKDLGEHRIFLLQNPPRVVVDIPNGSFSVPQEQISKAAGETIRAVRFGKPSPEKLRIIFDLNNKGEIEGSFVIPPKGDGGAPRLVVDIRAGTPLPVAVEATHVAPKETPKEIPIVPPAKEESAETDKHKTVEPVTIQEVEQEETPSKKVASFPSVQELQKEKEEEEKIPENVIPQKTTLPIPKHRPRSLNTKATDVPEEIERAQADTVKNLITGNLEEDERNNEPKKESRIDVLLPEKLKQKGKQISKKGVPAATVKQALAHADYKPVVVIDPGHGGVDPGAIGRTGIYEKQVTLGFAQTLKKALEEDGKYRVVMTRTRDNYITLKDRVEIARKANADIFISLHADSHPNGNMRGLSVYTLSDKASDREAAVLAKHANQGEKIDGVELAEHNQDTQRILIDMVRRDTVNASGHFAELLVNEMGQETKLLNNSHRFAGFMVLTSADVPSVLIELGYLSNPQEEKLLHSKLYKEKLIHGMVAAINHYFDGI